MSYDAISWAMKQDCGGAHAKMVLVALADFMNHSTGQLNPTIDSLAEASSMSRQGVLNQIESLVEKGLISVEHRHRKGNRYTLNMGADKSTTLTNPIVHAVDVSGQPGGLDKSTTLTRLVHHVDSNQERTRKEPGKNHAPRSRRKGFECPIPENVPQPLKLAIEQWRKYKFERRESYVETGWNQFLIKAESYPQADVIRCIQNSIASNYMGVVWPDKVRTMNGNQPDQTRILSKPPESDPEGWREFLASYGKEYQTWASSISTVKNLFRDTRAKKQ